jgi:hypothetical protein
MLEQCLPGAFCARLPFKLFEAANAPMYLQVLTAKGVKWQTRFAVLTSDRLSFATQPTQDHMISETINRNRGLPDSRLSRKELRTIFDRNSAGSMDG